ncbi:ferritin [Mycolicibacterium sp. S2-37]|uniref:ferritin n=1 Tax=Mycolicibacterium sp. S2-37 TaxID=2810297 RepID=UPI001A94DBAB|nr:ferritin [Mycolicibacterium sp. S2-37]MBO0678336.1 ferritin [Mycolicibacterium sp. S2-37]
MADAPIDDHVNFHKMLHEQIGREFAASQQYIAIAIYFDSIHLPQLAQRFYAQAGEERSHAMMMVQYLLDRDREVRIGGIDPVVATFESARDAVALALNQERQVTRQITELTRTARADDDFLGERFMQWFLQEQVEEVASMTTLLEVVEKAAGNIFDLEAYVARELSGAAQPDPTAPKAAGGGF